MSKTLKFGHLIEGSVEQDPLTDRFQLRTLSREGHPIVLDVDTLFSQFVGQDVRFTLVSVESLAKLAAMVEGSGAGAAAEERHSRIPISKELFSIVEPPAKAADTLLDPKSI